VTINEGAPIAAALLGACTLTAILWVNFARPMRRHWLMKNPAKAEFLIELADGTETRAKRMSVPPYSEVLIQLRLSPRLHYKETVLIFGFDGDPESKPLPIATHNTFIKVGNRRETPETNREHMIDRKDRYHIRRATERTKGNVFALGFEVKTRAPGTYDVCLEFMTDDGEGKPTVPLALVVEPIAGATSPGG
jgi:hypothetical protein